MAYQADCSASRKGRPFLWLSLVGVAIIVLVAGLFSAIHWSMIAMADTPELDRAIDAFLDDLGKGQIEAAYSRTTTRFQEIQSLPAFRKFVQQFPALETPVSGPYGRAIDLVSCMGRSQASASVYAHNSKASSSFNLILTKEEGEWKVDDFTAQ
jgi:hypothetical protein